jgi:sugar (pentulose or hexulose) kinase
MSGAKSAVVAVDVGTSAVRAALVHAELGVLATTRVARSASVGGELFDPLALLADVDEAIGGLREAAARGGDPAGSGVIGSGAGVLAPAALAISAHIGTVAVDASLAPVLPGGGWADPRGIDRLRALPTEQLDALLLACGRPAATGGAFALALELEASALGDRVAALLSPKDFLLAHLTGVIATDAVDAAYTGVSDVRARDWQLAAIEAAGVPAAWFPRQVAPDGVVGAVTVDASARCGLAAGTPVVAGGPDGSVGIGLLLGSSGHGIADVAGTTDVIGRLIDRPDDAPADAILNPALVADRWVAGGATGLSGGAVARWRGLVGAVDDVELAAVEPGCDGLRIVPTMSGERFPRWRPSGRGSVHGMGAQHGAAEILRAAQEGATFTVREGVDVLDPTRGLPLLFAGGSARSAHVAQLRADALGRVIRVAEDPDVTLLGAAALALVGSGIAGDLDDARDRLGLRFHDVHPDPAAAARYDDVYADWRRVRDLD